MGNTRNPRARISGGARKRALRYGAPITALAIAVAMGTAQADAATSGVSHTPTAVGSIAAVPAGAKAAAAPSDSTTINVDIALQPRNASELAQYANLVSDPNSVFYKQYLTKWQTQLLFAPSQSTVNAVSSALSAAGLKPGAAIDDNLFIPVKSTIGQLKQAFKIGFAGYTLSDGQHAFNATAVPKIDASVAGDVKGVIGFDNFLTPKTQTHTVGQSDQGAAASAAVLSQSAKGSGKSAVPAMCSAFTTSIDSYLKGFGYTGVDGGTYYSPTAMASAYGYANQLNSGNRGQGVTVAVGQCARMLDDDIADGAIDLGGQPGHRVDRADVTEAHRVVVGAQRHRRLPGALRHPCRLARRRDRAGAVPRGRPGPRAGHTELR